MRLWSSTQLKRDQGSVSWRSRNVFAPESHNKISIPYDSQSCFIQVFLIWREVPFIQEILDVYVYIRYRWTKNGYTGQESFRGFHETGPRCRHFVLVERFDQNCSEWQLLQTYSCERPSVWNSRSLLSLFSVFIVKCKTFRHVSSNNKTLFSTKETFTLASTLIKLLVKKLQKISVVE